MDMLNAKIAELSHWHGRCLTMFMGIHRRLRQVGRLFVIKSRWEAWAVTWAIAMGAVTRGKVYLATYPGMLGWMFFILCCGVVFVAGAKLLDATRPRPEPARASLTPHHQRRRRIASDHRPRRSGPLAGRRARPLNR